ncbi:glycosyltransferase [Campylobacter sputorum subsp. bubulus]|uniref:Glycosyltransferase n=1 Tax=Campylobacter sputorum subsp. sputorum TaxID=32024 RepID=A0A381DH86_9BACT|nr:glycosyltransferase family 4 protein [Campylobacter sputorum]ASM35115.1 glycosyltransferase, family 1 [Campylobacter sputorum aubsp. sputorum RM3237]KAB0581284.1 glycosyltransferase family 4 protein [Campylobacter sputorum subsp. sputorum]QEL05305.1 glycosyltransferase, family 1 [Campylobacter sputorum subsp. sputorum]SUX08895.1 glycosyltransferase [Campylobacter sputorum subsp. bubulus]SUX09854.1 glycosyltransferase [Campylobacter sputorum subsp. sputorum]
MLVVQLLPELNEGGVERGAVDISKLLDKDGIKSYVISNGGKLEKELKNHIKFDVCSKNIFTLISRIFKLRKILKELKPDIVHVRSRVPAWLVFFAKKGLNLNIISTVHGLNSVNFYSFIMVKSDKIIVPSNCVKEYILKNFHADETKISVIFRGVDFSDFNPSNFNGEILRTKFNLAKDDFIISCVGRITNLKNIETIIKALKFLPNAKLLVVGGVHKKRQKYFEFLKVLVCKLDLEKKVIFTGSISKIAEIYALSDVVVSASIKPESFGRSVAEAISLNTPVVASNHGGVKDIIIEGVNGYFFEPLDEKELSQKILMAKELKFDGFSYIKSKFSVEKMYNQTLQIYKELV